MSELIDLRTFIDARGNLTVVEKVLPFEIKRVFYIYGVDDSVRGGHRHIKTVQAAICLQGSCRINCHDGHEALDYLLDKPSKCLILYPEDYHTMDQFTDDAILMVFASDYFDPADYIHTPY
jgi:dTDP-4-dehydrorhamnose 3,5-epimerase-like enzyme